MIFFLGVVFGLVFFLLCFWRWPWALAIFCFAFPSYLIRLKYFNLPTTLLEIMWGGLVLSWAILYLKSDWGVIKDFFKENKAFFFFFLLFFIASISSIFVSDMWLKSLGQWRAYFFEPMILFLILVGRSKYLNWRFPLVGLLSSGVLVSLVALLQKTSSLFLPPSLWNDNLDGRVTSFFTSPNAVGLFLLPLIPLVVWLVVLNYQRKDRGLTIGWSLVLLGFLTAVFLSFSQGAWIGLGVAIVILLFLLGYKKISLILVVFGVLIVLVVPNIRSAVFFKDRAAQNRLVLWEDSVKYLTKSPNNFVLGTGIRQFFRKIEKPYYDVKVMERLIYPHNIFLNFWTEIGLFGLLGFLGLLAVVISWHWNTADRLIKAVLAAVWTGYIIHGLVDVPYFKNDLAFIFWLLVFFSWYFLKDKQVRLL